MRFTNDDRSDARMCSVLSSFRTLLQLSQGENRLRLINIFLTILFAICLYYFFYYFVLRFLITTFIGYYVYMTFTFYAIVIKSNKYKYNIVIATWSEYTVYRFITLPLM